MGETKIFGPRRDNDSGDLLAVERRERIEWIAQ